MKLSTWVSKAALAVVLSLGVTATTQAQGPYRRGYEHYGPTRGFYGRDFRYFGPEEIAVWRGGIWRHEWHDGRYGWWWLVDGYWYYYPAPIYPYPTYVPEAVVVEAPPAPAVVTPPAPVVVSQPQQSWYYCPNPEGYYPNVRTCSVPWQEVAAAPQAGAAPAPNNAPTTDDPNTPPSQSYPVPVAPPPH